MKLDPNKDIKIDVNDLNSEFRQFPVLLYRYVERAKVAQNDYDDLKEGLKEARSREYVRIKTESGKITEKNLEALIDTSELVLTAKKEMLNAKRVSDSLNAFLEGMRSKKDCMISISANMRAEDR